MSEKLFNIVMKYVLTILLLLVIVNVSINVRDTLEWYLLDAIPPTPVFFQDDDKERQALMYRDSLMKSFLASPSYNTSIPLGISYYYGTCDVTNNEQLLYDMIASIHNVGKNELNVEKCLDDIIPNENLRDSIDVLLEGLKKR